MPEKFSVQAVFTAVDQFSGPVARMSDTLNKFNGKGGAGGKGPKMGTVFNDAGAAIGRMGARAASARNAVTTVGVAGAFAAHKMISAGADLEDALLQGSSKFGDGVRRNTPVFEDLKRSALDLGRTTKFGAVEAANALEGLAASGFEPEAAMKNLPIIAKMALAGGEDLQTSSMIALKSMGAFGLVSDELGNLQGPEQLAANLTRVADVMAYTANQTTASIGSIFEALTEAGPVTKLAGMTFEKFAAITGVLSQAGIDSSSAGTAIKNIGVRLLSPTTEGSKELRRLKIDEKSFRKMSDPLDQLEVIAKAIDKLPKEEKVKAIDEYFGKIPLAGASFLANGGFRNARILEGKIMANAAGSNDRQAAIIGEGTSTKLGMLRNSFERINTAVFDKIKGQVEEATAAIIKFIDTNEGAVSDGFKNGVNWLKDNLPTVGKWLKYGAYAILGMQAAGAIHSLVTFGQDIALIGRALVTLIPKLWGATTALTTFVGVAQTGSGMGLWLSMAGGFTAIAIAATAAAAAIGSVMLAYAANEELKASTEGLGIIDLVTTSFTNAMYNTGPTDFAEITDQHQNALARQRAHTRAMLEQSSPAGAANQFDTAAIGSQYGDLTSPAALMGMLNGLEKSMQVQPLTVPPDRIVVNPLDIQSAVNAAIAQAAANSAPQATDAKTAAVVGAIQNNVTTSSTADIHVKADQGTQARVGARSTNTKINNHRTGTN